MGKYSAANLLLRTTATAINTMIQFLNMTKIKIIKRLTKLRIRHQTTQFSIPGTFTLSLQWTGKLFGNASPTSLRSHGYHEISFELPNMQMNNA